MQPEGWKTTYQASTCHRKWTTGVGPCIGCAREYPPKLQYHAMEQVNLSPRLKMGLPSPRVMHSSAAKGLKRTDSKFIGFFHGLDQMLEMWETAEAKTVKVTQKQDDAPEETNRFFYDVASCRNLGFFSFFLFVHGGFF